MILEGRQLTIGYQDRVVGAGLNVKLENGEVLALLGPNGGGKTTLLKTLLGLLSPKAGEVRLDGAALSSRTVRERARLIAYVPQTHIAWLDRLQLMHVDAHRVYVHAGVDPEVPLDRQDEVTMLWKRYPKGYKHGFGELHVVHGHDNDPDGPLLYEGRSNLDTLAWRTGRLTVGVFDDDRPGGPVELIVVRGTEAGP